MVALDTETHLIRPGLLAPPLVCVSTFAAGKRGLFLKAEGLEVARRALLSEEPIIGLNVAYDFGVLCAADERLLPLVFAKYDRGQVHDVSVREALIDIARGCLYRDPETGAPIGRYSMRVLAKRYLGLDLSEEKNDPTAWRLRYAELDGVPLDQWPQKAKDYATDDAEITHRIFDAQEAARLAGAENLHDEPDQVRAAWALHLASVWGIRTDPERVSKFVARVERDHVAARKKFLAAGLVKVRTCVRKEGVLEEPDQITAADLDTALQGAEWLPAVRKALAAGKALRYASETSEVKTRVTKAYAGNPPMSEPSSKFPLGQVKTDRDTLEQSGDELLDAFGGSSNVEKLRSTYVPILEQGLVVPINTKFNVLMASGRISSEKPNLTNQPRAGGVRQCYVARPGFVFGSADYEAGELCTLAQVLHTLTGGPTAMGDAIRSGLDLHVKLAAQFVGQTYEEMAARVKAKDKQARDLRQLAKPGNFGLPGGLGAAKLVLFSRANYGNLCELSGTVPAGKCGAEKVSEHNGRTTPPICVECLTVAEGLKAAWFEAWPEMADYFAWVSAQTEVDGRIEQLGSRRIRGQVGFCDGANTMFQGLLADGAKRAFYRIQRECYAPDGGPGGKASVLYGSRAIILVHDETIPELWLPRAFEAGHRVAQLMREGLQELCPDVPIRCEPVWMWRWLKGAEAFRDAEGKILPLVCEECPACEAVAPTNFHRAFLPHEEMREGKKTGRTCTPAAAIAA